MQQVVDLPKNKEFQRLGVQLLSISPDSIPDWKKQVSGLHITTPVLSDAGNRVARTYGVMQWRMGNEPGHTFVLIDEQGRVSWVRDYGGSEHGMLMYVAPDKLVPEIRAHLPI